MPYPIEIMRHVLDLDCDSFTPEEWEALAKQQIQRFQALERRYLHS